MSIVAIGYGKEKTLAHTLEAFRTHGCDFSFIDLDDIDNCQSASVSFANSVDELLITIDGHTHVLTPERSIYHRAYFRVLQDKPRSNYLDSVISHLRCFLDMPSVDAVNPMLSGLENGQKFYHLLQLRQHGFLVPETILSNTPEVVRDNVQNLGGWISKGASSIRTEASLVAAADLGHLDLISHIPSLFQRHIQGDNIRVHISPFGYVALRISTNAIDYRYALRDGFDISFERTEVNEAILCRCLEYMRSSRLVFAGFDFIANGNDWTVLECNPMPGYDFYDTKCDGAVSDLLVLTMENLSKDIQDGDSCVSLPRSNSRQLFIPSDRRPSLNHS